MKVRHCCVWYFDATNGWQGPGQILVFCGFHQPISDLSGANSVVRSIFVDSSADVWAKLRQAR
jgi:hypothetical protein